MEDIRRELREKVGLRPSDHWMTDCWRALSQTQQEQQPRQRQQPHPIADDVLEQVLHHDLRDVVRTFAADNTNQPSPTSNHGTANSRLPETALPSAQLRQAVHQSKQGGGGFRAALPSSFALMVQVEEVVDVSANAMSRLENGSPASDNRPPPSSTKRCLKIAYTDGYNPPSGDALYRENDVTPHESLVAVEVHVIPDLNVASPAGLKILLHGPLEIRRGVAFWHPGNATVLGGQVAALVIQQRQALEAAQRAAGVGIDPTVRALIGTTASTPEEDNDEGEHESGDVVAMSTTTAPMAPPLPTTTAVAVTTPPLPTTTTTLPPPANPYHSQRITPPPMAATSPPPALVGNPYSRTEPRPTPPTMATHAYQPSSSSTNKSRNSHYSGNSSGGGGSSVSNSSSSHQTEMTHAHTNRSPVNPYGRTTNRTTNTTLQSRPAVPPSTTSPVSHVVLRDTQLALIDNDTPMKNEEVVIVDDHVPVQSKAKSSTTTYHDLYNTLKHLVAAGSDAFGKACQREWLVELKQMVGPRVDFNVISRKQPGGKRKVYEYWLLYRFGIPDLIDQLVTCRLDTAIVQECFGLSAADLRQMRKTQNPEAQRISKEGGHRITARIGKPRLYRVTLIKDISESFWQDASHPLDGKQPLLYLREN